jgi:Protein of unknown function (DUF2917)
MERTIETMETTIPQGHTLRIQDGMGVELSAVDGCLWVTYQDDPADRIVEAGDMLRIGRDGLTLVHAFKAAHVRIAYRADAGAPSMAFGGGYREVGTRIVAAMFAGWARGMRDRFATAMAQRTAV